MQKRAIAVHDLSCVGRCSLTVVLPILSAAGIEVSALPTALLSTHSAGFQNYHYRDLSEDMEKIVTHWESLSLPCDTIYTGFLSSESQIDSVKEYITRLKYEKTLIMIDPVMGKNGKIYSVFSGNYPQKMSELCKLADIIVPNITEAFFLSGKTYHDGPYSVEEITELLHTLADFGCGQVVITGVNFDEGNLGAASFNKKDNLIHYTSSTLISPMFYGTGDVFGSALLAALLHELTLAQACAVAAQYTVDSINRTKISGTDPKYGVQFETGLTSLIQLIQNAVGEKQNAEAAKNSGNLA